jgi:hypothetical protein
MSLLKLYASGCQTDYVSHNVVYNINNKYDNLCKSCMENNTIPKLFFYYGPGLLSKITLPNCEIERYNTLCDKGHYFITFNIQ